MSIARERESESLRGKMICYFICKFRLYSGDGGKYAKLINYYPQNVQI